MLRKVRALVAIVIGGLVLSGITALPLATETGRLARDLAIVDAPEFLWAWIYRVNVGLRETYHVYPFVGYGTDWLAFGHFVAAIFLVGAWLDPVRNIWLLRAGQFACFLVIPYALICGAVREIPLWWRFVDCSFGVGGFVPLWFAERLTRRMQSDVN